jgi:hypothetical protein
MATKSAYGTQTAAKRAQAFRNAVLAKQFGAHKGSKGKTGGSKSNAWRANVGKKR